MYGVRIGGVAAVFLLGAPASPAEWSVTSTPQLEVSSARTSSDGYFIVAGNTGGPGGKACLTQQTK